LDPGRKTALDDAISTYLDDTAQLKSKKTHPAYSLTLKGVRSGCPTPKYRRVLPVATFSRTWAICAGWQRSGTVANRIEFLKIFFNRFKVKRPMEKTDQVKYTEKEVSAYNQEEIAAMLRVADLDGGTFPLSPPARRS